MSVNRKEGQFRQRSVPPAASKAVAKVRVVKPKKSDAGITWLIVCDRQQSGDSQV